jgi:hypothetical protein
MKVLLWIALAMAQAALAAYPDRRSRSSCRFRPEAPSTW